MEIKSYSSINKPKAEIVNTVDDETIRYTLNPIGANAIYLVEMSKLV